MAEENPLLAGLAKLTAEEKIGLDVPRQWVTGCQVMTTTDFTIFVFRDQTILEETDDINTASEKTALIKNIATIVMPTPVARELAVVLQAQMAGLDAGT